MFDFNQDEIKSWKQKCLRNILSSFMEDDRIDEFLISQPMIIENFIDVNIPLEYKRNIIDKISYILDRGVGEGNTSSFAKIASLPEHTNEIKFLSSSYKPGFIPPRIFQVRPDKPELSQDEVLKISWVQKHPSFDYICFDGIQGRQYLKTHYGERFVNAYDKIGYPAGQADFTALAILYKEGGIFADVFSTCRASIASLIDPNSFLTLFYHPERGVEKFLIAAQPRHPFIRRFLERALSLVERSHGQITHSQFTDQQALTLTIIDCICEEDNYLEKNRINFLERKHFDSVIEFNGEDEHIPGSEKKDPFLTIPITGLISSENWLGFKETHDNTILGGAPAAILPPAVPLTVIGRDFHPDWQVKQSSHAITPEANVYSLNMLGLSGHACLWQNNKFIRLNSYLSHVAETESRHGHWKSPATEGITRLIDDPVIVAFSAGYGCYGHYIVDDMPRIGLIRKVIGEDFFKSIKFIMPVKTPKWALSLLHTFFGISEDRIIFFDHEKDYWILRYAITSEYLHRNYVFNPFVKDFYRSYVRSDSEPFRKICLSRRSWEAEKTHQRVFEQQEWFEEEARRRGYEVISPEKLPIMEQIKLLCETKIQIGEHGSAQHASIYSSSGMTVGTINPLGDVQINLGRLSQDRNILVYESASRRDERHNTFYSCKQNDLFSFFDILE